MALGHCVPGEPRPRWRMSGWKIEYLPAAWGTPVLSHECLRVTQPSASQSIARWRREMSPSQSTGLMAFRFAETS